MPDFEAYELMNTDDAIAFEETELKKLNTLFKMFGMGCKTSHHRDDPGFDLEVWESRRPGSFYEELYFFSELRDLYSLCQDMITKFQNNEQVYEFF
jgi:hypothetical protein